MKKHLAITEIEIPEAEVSGDEEEEEESTELPEITPEMKKQISQSLSSPPNVTLVECYRYVEFAKPKKFRNPTQTQKSRFFEFWVWKTRDHTFSELEFLGFGVGFKVNFKNDL